MCEERFNESIRTVLNERNNRGKPLWTRERLEEATIAVEQFKLAPELKLKRTPKQYYYGKKYDVIEAGNKKCLILKRKSNSDPVVKVVPADEFYHILRETHQSTGHGGRIKMICHLKKKYYIPSSVVIEFLKQCSVCQAKRLIQGERIMVHPNWVVD